MINFFNLRNQGFGYYFNNPSEIVLINLFKYIYIKIKFLFSKVIYSEFLLYSNLLFGLKKLVNLYLFLLSLFF